MRIATGLFSSVRERGLLFSKESHKKRKECGCFIHNQLVNKQIERRGGPLPSQEHKKEAIKAAKQAKEKAGQGILFRIFSFDNLKEVIQGEKESIFKSNQFLSSRKRKVML